MAKIKNIKKSAYLMVVYASVLWGLCPIVYKYALPIAGVVAFLAGRFAFGALAIYISERKKFTAIPKKLYLIIAAMALFNSIILNVVYSYAVQNTSVLHIAVIGLMTPFTVYFFANLLIKERTNRHVVIGASISMTGLLLIIAGSGNGYASGLLGDVFMLLYVAINAVIIVISRRVLSSKKNKLPAEQLAFGEYLLSAIVLVPASLYLSMASDSLAISVQAITIMAVAGTVFGAVPMVLYYRAAKILPANRLADTNFISPFVAIISGVVLLGEQFTPQMLVGTAVLLTGLLLSNNKIHPVFIAHQLYLDEQLVIRAFRQPQKAYSYITTKINISK